MDLEKALDTTSNVLSVLAQIANTPGINMLPYVSVAATAITALNAAVQAGRNISPYVEAIVATYGDGKKVPTEAELTALDEKIAQLEVEIQKPLSLSEEGEPD